MPEPALDRAITLIRAGQPGPARQILTEVLKQNPNSEQAWLWVSKCFDSPERKRYCFERVLKANPQNPIARKALHAMKLNQARTQREAARRAGNSSLQAADEYSPVALPQPAADQAFLARRMTFRYWAGLLALVAMAMFAWAGVNYLLPARIPISHAQVKSHLTAMGVFCGAQELTVQNPNYAYVMRCSGFSSDGRAQVAVDIYSRRRVEEVSLILAYVIQKSGAPSADVLGGILSRVAALPYKNASPQLASAWVQQNFPALLDDAPGEDPEGQFGRVRFHLASLSPSRKYLAIGEGQK